MDNVIRAYQDGEQRLVVVIDNPDDSMTKLVTSLLTGSVKDVEGLEPPVITDPVSPQTDKMREIGEKQSPGHIQAPVSEDDASPATEEAAPKKSPAEMSVFELRDFLNANRNSPMLAGALRQKGYPQNLDFVIYTKSENELRELALMLA